MAGNYEGGLKAAAKNKANDPDFYKKIGTMGGAAGTTGGFYYAKNFLPIDDPRHPSHAGRIGGKISRRKRKVV